MVKGSRRNKQLGLNIVLVVALLTGNTVYLRAETVDDLKASLGIEVEKETESLAEDNVIEDNEFSIDTKSASQRLSEVKSSISSYEKRLQDALDSKRNNIKASNIAILVQNIQDKKNELVEVERLVDLEEQINKDFTMSIEEYTEDEVDIESTEYDIGLIGNRNPSPVKNYFKLVTPYGYKLNEDGTHGKKLTNIDLAANKGDKILSQWNGVIAEIKSDDTITGAKTITIYHGRDLYTIYSHVEPLKELVIGKKVRQGEEIGSAVDTKTDEEDKLNHISFQVAIEDKFINPLLIFGTKGEKAYKQFIKTTSDRYAIAQGENYYYNEKMQVDNPNKKEEDEVKENTVEGAASLESGYEVPNPGVVN